MEPTLTQHIELRPTRDGSVKAFIAGTRVRVQDIVSDHECHGRTPDEVANEYPHISLAQVHAALAYYFDNREEIRGQMKADREKAATQRRSQDPDANGEDTEGDSVSS
ncbi:MAG: DUF433 domain-containing protein [Planctomycetes bacterium]|nr:DUF433 domain-containing protein [Planctomycetota bacterium]